MEIENLIQKLSSSGSSGKITRKENLIPRELLQNVISERANGYQPTRFDDRDREIIINSIKSRAKLDILDKKREGLSNENIFFEFAKQFSDSGLVTMDYHTYKVQATLAPASVKRFFTAANFMLFPRNKDGCICCEDFLRFIQRSIDIEISSLQLLSHSRELTNGFMTELELERYIYELVPVIPECQRLDIAFYPYYVFTAARRFFFFLDPRRTRKVSIKRLAHSTIMEEFIFLRRISRYNMEMDVTAQLKMNWFSGNNALRLYSSFIALDTDQNGMLSIDELMHFSGNKTQPVQLTYTAVSRLFEENITYSPMEMDYKGFLDLMLALENRSTVESMVYFWRALDVEKSGRLTPAAIQFFFRDISESLRMTGYEVASVDNITAEIYDMLSCHDTVGGATFDEFVRSGQGATVSSMLLDVNGFWQYDNRESLKQSADADDNEQEEDSHAHNVPASSNNGVDYSNGRYDDDFDDPVGTDTAPEYDNDFEDTEENFF